MNWWWIQNNSITSILMYLALIGGIVLAIYVGIKYEDKGKKK